MTFQGSLVTTAGGLALHTGDYRVRTFKLGENKRRETWLMPWGGRAILAKKSDDPTIITLGLKVTGSSMNNLIGNMALVREEFSQIENELTWSVGGTARAYHTYPSPLNPAIDDLEDAELKILVNRFIVTYWELNIWRDPYPTSQARVPVA